MLEMPELRRKGHLRVVLRDVKKAEYFAISGTWTGNLNEARDFQTSVSATEAALQMRQDGLEVILLFSDPGHDLSLPINCF